MRVVFVSGEYRPLFLSSDKLDFPQVKQHFHKNQKLLPVSNVLQVVPGLFCLFYICAPRVCPGDSASFSRVIYQLGLSEVPVDLQQITEQSIV